MAKPVTVIKKGHDGRWHYDGFPDHEAAPDRLLEGLKPGVRIAIYAPDDAPGDLKLNQETVRE